MNELWTQIWSHFPGYGEARSRVERQSMLDDVALIDDLFGRGNLAYGATPGDVKAEALRQLEIEWRSERNLTAEFHLAVMEAMR